MYTMLTGCLPFGSKRTRYPPYTPTTTNTTNTNSNQQRYIGEDNQRGVEDAFESYFPGGRVVRQSV